MTKPYLIKDTTKCTGPRTVVFARGPLRNITYFASVKDASEEIWAAVERKYAQHAHRMYIFPRVPECAYLKELSTHILLNNG